MNSIKTPWKRAQQTKDTIIISFPKPNNKPKLSLKHCMVVHIKKLCLKWLCTQTQLFYLAFKDRFLKLTENTPPYKNIASSAALHQAKPPGVLPITFAMEIWNMALGGPTPPWSRKNALCFIDDLICEYTT